MRATVRGTELPVRAACSRRRTSAAASSSAFSTAASAAANCFLFLVLPFTLRMGAFDGILCASRRTLFRQHVDARRPKKWMEARIFVCHVPQLLPAPSSVSSSCVVGVFAPRLLLFSAQQTLRRTVVTTRLSLCSP